MFSSQYEDMYEPVIKRLKEKIAALEEEVRILTSKKEARLKILFIESPSKCPYNCDGYCSNEAPGAKGSCDDTKDSFPTECPLQSINGGENG